MNMGQNSKPPSCIIKQRLKPGMIGPSLIIPNVKRETRRTGGVLIYLTGIKI
jgi:hypothetical protein